MVDLHHGLATICPLALLIVAAVVDVRQRYLPAWLTLGSIAGGFVVAATAGLGGIALSLLGLLVGGGLLLPFALVGGMGWADVLLLGAVGAWEGWGFAVRTALWMALLGAALAIIAWRRGHIVFPYVPAIALGALAATLLG